MSTVVAPRPLAVRVLRATGWVAALLGAAGAIPAFTIGLVDDFRDVSRVWIALGTIGIVLLLAGVAGLLAAHRSPAGLGSGLIACTLLLILLPLGTMVTVAIALIASQTWPQLREYYGLGGRTA